MLSNIDLDDKGYERIREESIARIPIYSREWTNYNISDPGITILENFSAFMALQQSEINEIPEKIRLGLLALAGFTAHQGKCATAYLLPKTVKEPYMPPERMKLYAQDICFELEQCAMLREMPLLSVGAGSSSINGEQEKALLGKNGVKGGFPLFGERPSGGETVSFYLSGIPEVGQKVAIFIELAQQFDRNPFADPFDAEHPNPFAEVLWEVDTADGYEPLKVEDGTYCFLQSGYVVFSLDEKLRGKWVKDHLENAYKLRVTLERADYDIVPRFQRICGLLVPAIQRDTWSDVIKLPVEDGKICIRNYLIGNDFVGNDFAGNVMNRGYLEVYGKESDGDYHRYFDLDGMDRDHEERRRFYRVEYSEGFTAVLTFTKYSGQESNTDTSEKMPQEALVVCRDGAMAAYSSLGRLYGYDDQEILLPESGVINVQNFSVLVVERCDTGDEICHMVKPGSQTAGEVCYHVREQERVLIVQDCGRYEGAELRIGNAAFYAGDGGNIRAGTELAHAQKNFRLDFVNCSDVVDGSFAEDFEQVRRRFVEDLAKPATMVTEDDCVKVVKNVPGLSIHKVGIFSVAERNEIQIAVKPNSNAAFPKLSETYRREISRYLERCRMLTTKLFITQPVYVPIHVHGTVSVGKHFAHKSEKIGQKIKETLTKMLDGIQTEACFGSRVVFHELYRRVENMDCVEEVIELSVAAGSSQWADKAGLDILLKPNALYYPGDIYIEVAG